MEDVRLGIIGVGNMGKAHARNVLTGKVKGLKLAALADLEPAQMAEFSEVKQFPGGSELIASGAVDAVLIATPHYDHTTLGIEALQMGLHTLVEKPLSVHKADAERLIAAYTDKSKVFAAMFNQRTDPHYTKLRKLIHEGELGQIRRVVWVITNWFRTETYYASGGWRATWKGEGGGVLLNQCPHQIDLFQWLFGMPAKVRAHCHFGLYHDIEVDDDVTAYFEYPDGQQAVFITSTGEAPGTNRLEISGERGKVTVDGGGDIQFIRNEVAMNEFSRTAASSFSRPGTWDITIPVSGNGGQHVEIMQNFSDAIREGKELIAPAVEGIHSVELANAMLYSAWTESTVQLPLDAAAYEAALKEKIANSTARSKKVVAPGTDDFAKSF